jgi:phenylacetate-CoA ligase
MNILEQGRGVAFWMLDAIKKSQVKNALSDLANCENEIWNEEQIAQYQKEHIAELLDHARKTVPYYGGVASTDIRDWPIVNKNVLKENGVAVLSTLFEKDQLIPMFTSGSTGTPFTSWQNIAKKKHVNAETLYYNGQVGFSIGRRIIYLRSVVSEVQKSGIQQFAQNIYLLDCNNLSDEGIKEKLAFIVKYSKGCGAMLMGYASTLEAFHKYFEKYGYDEVKEANVYGVVSGSEMLYDSTRESIERAFGCRCVSRYANEENGFLGQDDEENNVFFMNRADYYIEIFKMDCDILAEENEVGRIVVTDFFNYAMPMIRYDTGDVGAYVRKRHNGVERWAISSFGGRKVDTVQDCEGNLISPYSITNLMWSFQCVKQFQFIQKNYGEYSLLLSADQSVVDENKMISDYKKIFGDKSVFEIHYCDDIPVMSSGKRRYIVNKTKG